MAALGVAVLLTGALLLASPSPAVPMPADGEIVCHSVHETWPVGAVFADEHCRRVKCLSYQGQGYVGEVESCPTEECQCPEGTSCRMVRHEGEQFPQCCPSFVCDIQF